MKEKIELRYNPISDEWVIVSGSRQDRPNIPQNSCPLCPDGIEALGDYDLVSFENRYPALKREPQRVIKPDSYVFKKREAKGICEVVVYTKEHNLSLPQMPILQIEKLIEMWVDRTKELQKYEFIKYIYIFENRGQEVGATLSHPHGQIYAFPFIPKRINAKIRGMEKWFYEYNECPICKVIEEELKDKKRIVYENKHFIGLVPFYARFPYEVHIYPKRHVDMIAYLSNKEKKDLADILKIITMKYDKLFEIEFPYMMMLFQAPVNGEDLYDIFHFHIEFDPPKRTKDKIKWMASVETGTWTFINPLPPEEAAKQLRDIKVK